MSDRLWITDFKYDDGAMLVKKTGHRVPLTLSLAHDIFTYGSASISLLRPGAHGAV